MESLQEGVAIPWSNMGLEGRSILALEGRKGSTLTLEGRKGSTMGLEDRKGSTMVLEGRKGSTMVPEGRKGSTMGLGSRKGITMVPEGRKGSTLAHCVRTKYVEEQEEQEQGGLVLFLHLSSSPEARAGLLPTIITLNDTQISRLGDLAGLQLSHVTELDLTGNSLSSWLEVLDILQAFPALTFLNLAHNQLSGEELVLEKTLTFPLTKLVLNCNPVSWRSVSLLLPLLPHLQELRLSSCSLPDPGPGDQLGHAGLSHLYLSCNPLSSFSLLTTRLLAHLPSLSSLSLAECPNISLLPDPASL